ncbi:hypothetical protein OAV49_01745 [Alphaproteobacteria bacterium]|nr:hypothetical protein [Alphaproteobacteria bacterium]
MKKLLDASAELFLSIKLIISSKFPHIIPEPNINSLWYLHFSQIRT